MAQRTASNIAFQIPSYPGGTSSNYALERDLQASLDKTMSTNTNSANLVVMTPDKDGTLYIDEKDQALHNIGRLYDETAANNLGGVTESSKELNQTMANWRNQGGEINRGLADDARSMARDTASVPIGEKKVSNPEGYTTPAQFLGVGRMIDFARKEVNAQPVSYIDAITNKAA